MQYFADNFPMAKPVPKDWFKWKRKKNALATTLGDRNAQYTVRFKLL